MKIHIDQTGFICSLGNTTSEIYQNMCSGKDSFRPLYRFDTAPYRQKIAGQVSPKEEEILRKQFPDDDLTGAFIKIAGNQALAEKRFASSKRTGIVLATNFGPLEYQEWLWQEKIDIGKVSIESQELLNQFNHTLCEYLNIAGPLAQISMSCASGGSALQIARDMLERNRADQVLVVAYDLISEYSWCGLHNLHTITTDIMQPFDTKRSGTIFSEGAAALLVSRDDSPIAAQSPYFITGITTNNNAQHLTAPLPMGEGSRRVMSAALHDAHLRPEQVEHICAHATSTRANDKTEAEALNNLFGSHLAKITTAAHKSQLGHLLGAATLAETIITLEAMKHSIIPPNLTLTELDPDCKNIDSIPKQARYRKFNNAIINSAGIGGNNCAVILEKKMALRTI